MSDQQRPLEAFLLAEGCGSLQLAVPLKGRLVLRTGESADPYLVQTDRGAWIVGVKGAVGLKVDLLSAHPLRYETRLLGDHLGVGADSFTVPLSKGGDVQLALGVGRIRRDHAVGSSLGQARHPRGPWVDSTTPQEEAWLDAALDPDDPVIAWLHTSLSTRFQDSIEPGCEAAFRLLITRDRVALVAISRMGDVTVSPLPDKALILTEGRTPSLQVGDQSWEPVGNSSAFRQVASLPAHVGSARLRAAAAKATEAGAEGNILADHLLTRLLPEDAPIDRLIAAARARPVRDGELRHALAGLPRNEDGALALAEWAAGWNPALEVVERVLASLVQEAEDPAASRFSLPLHRVQRDRVLASTPDPFAKAEADIALAEHLLYAGEVAEARALLLSRRPALPDEELAEVLPPEDADLTAGEGGQPAHIRLLELLARATDGAAGEADSSALAALARHQPLLRRRLEALAETAPGDLGRRAQSALAASRPKGLLPAPASSPPSTGLRPLTGELLEKVRHPAARADGALSRVQSAVARVNPPDFSILRSHCERVSALRQPVLATAIADACVVFGLPVVDAYVSQGDRRVGLRSHESPAPFLVVGGGHLDSGDDFFLGPAELRWAIGAEVAHLRFGHSRVTSDDVWAGLMDKGGSAVVATASILPFLRFLPVDLLGSDRTWRAVRTVVPQSWLRAVYGIDDAAALAKVVPTDLGRLGNAGAAAVESATGTLGSLQSVARRFTPAKAPDAIDPDVGLDNRLLVASHRVMQHTADRAGLLMAGHIDASLRAIFLTHSRLARELTVANDQGLDACLGRKDAEGRLLLPDLAVRMAALIAFWLSDDYPRLRQAMGAAPERG